MLLLGDVADGAGRAINEALVTAQAQTPVEDPSVGPIGTPHPQLAFEEFGVAAIVGAHRVAKMGQIVRVDERQPLRHRKGGDRGIET